MALWNEILTLWHTWWSGESTSGLRVGGFRVFVWVRIGKLLQLLGGGTVILDLYGPERLDRRVRDAEVTRSRLRMMIDLNIFVFGLHFQKQLFLLEKWKEDASPLWSGLVQVGTAALILPIWEGVGTLVGAVLSIALIYAMSRVVAVKNIVQLALYSASQTFRISVEAPFARLLHRRGYPLRVVAVAAIIFGFVLDISGS